VISTSQFKSGIVIKYNNDLYEILEWQLVKMQQRQPIVSTKMRNIRNGSVLDQKFRSGDKFEDVHLEERPIQYLYHDNNRYHFMDNESYHEIAVSAELLGDRANYMKENTEVSGRYCDDELISVELPAAVTLQVTETEPGVRGDTAKSGNKPAKVETGAIVKVPLFVTTGDLIRVDTRTGEYLERA
jgi:elongation factor P